MSLALKRLQDIGWLALVFVVAIMLYPLSLNVAAVHSDLVSVDSKIREAKREISFLQAELRTRASLQQLDEWNTVLYGYQPPTAEQFLSGENALAQLNGEMHTIKPVMISSMDQAGVAPAGTIGSSNEKTVSSSSTAADSKQEYTPPTKETKQDVKLAMIQIKGTAGKPSVPIVTARTQKLASIDDKLLSDDLIKDLKSKSDKERKRK